MDEAGRHVRLARLLAARRALAETARAACASQRHDVEERERRAEGWARLASEGDAVSTSLSEAARRPAILRLAAARNRLAALEATARQEERTLRGVERLHARSGSEIARASERRQLASLLDLLLGHKPGTTSRR